MHVQKKGEAEAKAAVWVEPESMDAIMRNDTLAEAVRSSTMGGEELMTHESEVRGKGETLVEAAETKHDSMVNSLVNEQELRMEVGCHPLGSNPMCNLRGAGGGNVRTQLQKVKAAGHQECKYVCIPGVVTGRKITKQERSPVKYTLSIVYIWCLKMAPKLSL